MSLQGNWTLGYAHTHTHTHRVIVYVYIFTEFINDDMKPGICIDINLWIQLSRQEVRTDSKEL